jgi:hypothetical protein
MTRSTRSLDSGCVTGAAAGTFAAEESAAPSPGAAVEADKGIEVTIENRPYQAPDERLQPVMAVTLARVR